MNKSEDKTPELERLDAIDQFIRQGQTRQARLLLTTITKKTLPRDHLARVANYCRRSGMTDHSLKLLGKIIRSDKKIPVPPNAFEKAEYAAALAYLGASAEALALLASIKTETFPDARLFEAFAYIVEWDYKNALVKLEQYLASTSLSDYQRLVGNVNYAAALVHFEDGKKATPLLNELLEKTRKENNTLLQNHILCLMIQNSYQIGKIDLAQTFCAEALQGVAQNQGSANLLVRQWKAIISLKLNPKKTREIEALNDLREEAFQGKEWEIARNCDYQLAILTQSKSLFEHLYYGSPSESYRARLVRQYTKVMKGDFPPQDYTFVIANPANKAPRQSVSIDSRTGENTCSAGFLKPQQLPQKLLLALCRDFYRPQNYGALFAQLFPKSYFNPYSSVNLLDQLMHRLRNWFKTNKIPLGIQTDKGFNKLQCVGNSEIKIGLKTLQTEEILNPLLKKQIEELKRHFGKNAFSSNEAAKKLKISERSTRRLLKNGCDRNLAKKIGSGKLTQFSVF